MAKCSFGRVSLHGLFDPIWPVGTDIFARLFYINAGGTEVLIAAMDTLATYRSDTIVFRERISELTGIPADNIWYHELQTHATPDWDALTGQPMINIAEAVSKEVLSMKERAVEFTCEVAEVYAGMKYTVKREQYVAGLGGVSVWLGFDYEENGRVYSQRPSQMLLRGYEPDLPVFDKPIYFDNPVDPRASLFVFRNTEGKVFGTISRFAAHPDVAVLFEHLGGSDYHYDYDWPGYLSTKLEAEFDAPSMYINGPCADLATKKRTDDHNNYEKSAKECKRIGEEIADMLLAGYQKKTVPLGDIENCKAKRFTIELPLREDFPHSKEAYANWEERVAKAEEELQAAIAAKEPEYRIKQLVDERWKAHMTVQHVYMIDKTEPEAFTRRTFTVDVTAMRFGDYLFIGVPGESMVEMTEFLCSSFSGVKTIPLDQVNGYYHYFATPATLTLGGYTYWQSILSREAIPMMKDRIMEELADF